MGEPTQGSPGAGPPDVITDPKLAWYSDARARVNALIDLQYAHFGRLMTVGDIGLASLATVANVLRGAEALIGVWAVALLAAFGTVATSRAMGRDDAETGRLLRRIMAEVEPNGHGSWDGWERHRRTTFTGGHPLATPSRGWFVANRGTALALQGAFVLVALASSGFALPRVALPGPVLAVGAIATAAAGGGAMALTWRALSHRRERRPPGKSARTPEDAYLVVEYHALRAEVAMRRDSIARGLSDQATRVLGWGVGAGALVLTSASGRSAASALALNVLAIGASGLAFLIAVQVGRNELRARQCMTRIRDYDQRFTGDYGDPALWGRPIDRPAVIGPASIALGAGLIAGIVSAPTVLIAVAGGALTVASGGALLRAAAHAMRWPDAGAAGDP